MAALFMVSATGSSLAQDVRPASAEELTRFCTDEGIANFGVLSVDTSQSKPFEIVSCFRKVITRTDCLWMGKMLDMSDRQNKLDPAPQSEGQKRIDDRRKRQLGEAYTAHCGLF